MSDQPRLTVRQHERWELEVPAVFIVDAAHREQLRFGTSSTAIEPHVVSGTTIDLSPGGVGIRCLEFVPRMCAGTLRIIKPGASPPRDADRSDDNVVFEHGVRVRRVEMIGHEPSYSLGLSFVDTESGMERDIPELVRRLSDMLSAAAAAAGGADG